MADEYKVKDYGEIKKTFQPTCVVGGCGVVNELIGVYSQNKELIDKINKLRQEREMMAALEENKNELTSKYTISTKELEYYKEENIKLDTLMTKLKIELDDYKGRLEHEKKKTSDILSYSAADSVIQDKMQRLKELTIEEDKKEKHNAFLSDNVAILERKHDEILKKIEEWQAYLYNVMQYNVGALKIMPSRPEEYQPVKIEAPKAKKMSIFARLRRR